MAEAVSSQMDELVEEQMLWDDTVASNWLAVHLPAPAPNPPRCPSARRAHGLGI